MVGVEEAGHQGRLSNWELILKIHLILLINWQHDPWVDSWEAQASFKCSLDQLCCLSFWRWSKWSKKRSLQIPGVHLHTEVLIILGLLPLGREPNETVLKLFLVKAKLFQFKGLLGQQAAGGSSHLFLAAAREAHNGTWLPFSANGCSSILDTLLMVFLCLLRILL